MRNEEFLREIKFRTSRSSGSGGQHVNKVETRVELVFNVWHSQVLDAEEKAIISHKLKNRISKYGFLQISSQAKRSQLLNKQRTLDLFFELIKKALTPQKARIPVKPTKKMKAKRLQNKRHHSEKKANRKKVNLHNRD